MPYYGLSVQIVDQASPFISGLLSPGFEKRINMVMGKEGVKTLRAHLNEKDSDEPNKLGGKRTHFFNEAMRSTHFITENGLIQLGINHVGIAQRYFGGDIYPVNARKLAIPARAEAHGTRPKNHDNLQVLYGKRGAYALAEREASNIGVRTTKGVKRTTKRKDKQGRREIGGMIMFWLVDSVTQAPDLSVLPPLNSLLNKMVDEGRDYYLRSKSNA